MARPPEQGRAPQTVRRILGNYPAGEARGAREGQSRAKTGPPERNGPCGGPAAKAAARRKDH